MPRTTIIISQVDHSLGFQMLADGFAPHELSFILLNHASSPIEAYLKNSGFNVKRLPIATSADKLKVIFNLFGLWIVKRPQVVHSHNRFAYLLTIPLAWMMRIRKRIYTRHHSDFQHNNYPNKVYQDKLINRLCTNIVSISKIVTEILTEIEDVPDEKIVAIPHGFDLFPREGEGRSKSSLSLMKRHGIKGSPIIGVISRFVELKGVEYIINGFKGILATHPNAHLVLANAQGPHTPSIMAELEKVHPDNYSLVPFEKDTVSLYHSFDVFVHTPIEFKIEAFGQTYVEAMATSTPSIFTLSGIANEICVHRENSIVVDHKNSDDIRAALLSLISDEDLRKTLVVNGLVTAGEFSREKFIDSHRRLYGFS